MARSNVEIEPVVRRDDANAVAERFDSADRSSHILVEPAAEVHNDDTARVGPEQLDQIRYAGVAEVLARPGSILTSPPLRR